VKVDAPKSKCILISFSNLNWNEISFRREIMNKDECRYICPFCAFAVPSDGKFCPNCGASLDALSEPVVSDGIPSKTHEVSPVSVYSSSQVASSRDYYGPTQQQSPAAQGTFYQPVHPMPPPQKVVYIPNTRPRNSSEGTLALIFAILSCVGILPCLGSILAITLGQKAADTPTGTTAVILGWITFALYVIAIIISIIFYI